MSKVIFGSKQFDLFGARYVDLLTEELMNAGKKATGNLINSLDYRIVQDAQALQIIIQANDYLTYVDQGVNGTERSYGSPFSYTNKFPPIQAIKNWCSIKGIPQGAAFPIARNIFKFGIKPTYVIEKTVQKMVDQKSLTQLQKIITNNVQKYMDFELFDGETFTIKK